MLNVQRTSSLTTKMSATRAIKNAKHLQKAAPDIIPEIEPQEGYQSIIPFHTLSRLHLSNGILPGSIDKVLADRLQKVEFAQLNSAGPLFNGTLLFVKILFTIQDQSNTISTVSDADYSTALDFAFKTANPISKYAAQYGPNSILVRPDVIDFSVTLPSNSYNDSQLQSWVNTVANNLGLDQTTCLVILNPPSMVNNSAPVAMGFGGYHSMANNPYIFVNLGGVNLTISDPPFFYAGSLSHEIAEMVVDPFANLANPEVCDPCGPNCVSTYINYFDSARNYIATSQAFPPPFAYDFYINGIVKPANAQQCPAPADGCVYFPLLSGIGGFDLKLSVDKLFAFDYDGDGKPDDLVLYRPGTGAIFIVKNQSGQFIPVYAQGDPGNGIGGFDLLSPEDRVFAFDYNSSGNLDHLVIYRPGTGTIWILQNHGGQFVPVYAQGDPGNGIGGFDLLSPEDRVFAFDYNSSGRLDHLVIYRPGTGTIWILQNQGGQFIPVYAQGDPGNGIGGFNLLSPEDRVFAFDYNSSGRLDHLVVYRPGTGTIWILQNQGGQFIPVYAQGDPGNGIGGFDLLSPEDRVFAFDYNSSGNLDHLVIYRPGTGTIWILQNQGGQFVPVYAQGDPGNGIGDYDLLSPNDQIISFDYDSSGKQDHLVLCRPGTGTVWILNNSAHQFAPVYTA